MYMREIVLDTETTGLDPQAAHKIVEVACVELVNHMQTGNHFHVYVNPERDMPEEAFRIHGLPAEFLSKHEAFGAIAADLLTFIGGSPLVIHNAGFDMKFLNYELRAAGFPSLESHPVVDTLPLARRAFPGAQASLDALCRRFKIDLSRRSKHGALLDAQLLAQVYLELKGGKQRDLAFHKAPSHGEAATAVAPLSLRQSRPQRSFPLSAEDERLHQAFLQTFKNHLWYR